MSLIALLTMNLNHYAIFLRCLLLLRVLAKITLRQRASREGKVPWWQVTRWLSTVFYNLRVWVPCRRILNSKKKLHRLFLHETENNYWVPLRRLLYNLQLWRPANWFRKFTLNFRSIRKELESSMHNDFDNWENVFVSRRLLSQTNITLGTNLQNALLTVRPAFNYCAIANCIAPWDLFYPSNHLIGSIWNL